MYDLQNTYYTKTIQYEHKYGQYFIYIKKKSEILP